MTTSKRVHSVLPVAALAIVWAVFTSMECLGAPVLITDPADPIVGFENTVVGGNSTDGGNYPGNEDPPNAIDGNTATKYLNVGEVNSGFYITPGAGSKVLKAVRIFTANDRNERDPLTVSIEGANGGDLSQGSSWTLIANPVNLGIDTDPGRLTAGPQVNVASADAYSSYRIIIQSVRNAGSANSTQYAEFELYGSDPAIDFGGLTVSNLTTTTAVLYATAGTNLTSASVVWDTEDKGMTNLAAWAGETSATGTTPGTISGTVTNLSPDTEYTYRFYGEDGATNGWSGPVSFATELTGAQAPVFTAASTTWYSVVLEWADNAATETGYVLQRSTNGVDYAELASLDQDSTTYADAAVIVGETYYYRLTVTNDVNGSSTDPSACETNATMTPTLPEGMIFYDSFEDPVVDGRTGTPPTGWEKTASTAGVSDGGVAGKTGDQFAWVGRYGGKLTTANTHLTNALQAHVNYALTFDLSASRTDGLPWAIVELLAGTNVIAVTTNVVTTANNLSAQSISMSFLALPDHPHLGETLGIRLGTLYNVIHNQFFYFDDMVLYATDTSGDTTPPTPTNMTWNALPTSSVNNSITMQATNAVDTNGVQYFFTNTVNGNVSGWQESPFWSNTGLTPGVAYSYKVKARDKSVNTNETGWSSEESAECEPYIILYESFEHPSIRQIARVGFNTPQWFLPPPGWTCDDNNRVIMLHDVAATWPVETPFGEQFAGVREPHYVETVDALSGHVLEANYTYRVTYNSGCAGERAGEEDGVPGINIVELIAGSTVVASTSTATTLDDFSETTELEFMPDAAHTNLGEALKLKLSADTGAWWHHVIYDNIKVYAIPRPPPKGTMLIVR